MKRKILPGSLLLLSIYSCNDCMPKETLKALSCRALGGWPWKRKNVKHSHSVEADCRRSESRSKSSVRLFDGSGIYCHHTEPARVLRQGKQKSTIHHSFFLNVSAARRMNDEEWMIFNGEAHSPWLSSHCDDFITELAVTEPLNWVSPLFTVQIPANLCWRTTAAAATSVREALSDWRQTAAATQEVIRELNRKGEWKGNTLNWSVPAELSLWLRQWPCRMTFKLQHSKWLPKSGFSWLLSTCSRGCKSPVECF